MPRCAWDMRQEISELHQSLKTTMIYVTHDQVEAMTMADKIVVLNAGASNRWAARWSFTNTREPLCRRLHRQPEDEP
jgi:ABC-type sugar transport system ATPase subunit